MKNVEVQGGGCKPTCISAQGAVVSQPTSGTSATVKPGWSLREKHTLWISNQESQKAIEKQFCDAFLLTLRFTMTWELLQNLYWKALSTVLWRWLESLDYFPCNSEFLAIIQLQMAHACLEV